MTIHHGSDNELQSQGCFIPQQTDATYTHVIPIEYPVPQTDVGCIEIEINNQENIITHGYDKYNEHEDNPGCFNPVEQDEKVLIHKQDKTTES